LYYDTGTNILYYWNGTAWTASGGGASGASLTRYTKTTAKAVNTTTAATDLLNAEITLAANTLLTGKRLRADLYGDFLNNSGGNGNCPRIQVIVGGTTVLDSASTGSYSNSATRVAWHLVVEAVALGAANSQLWWMQFFIHGLSAAPGRVVFNTGTGVASIAQPGTANDAAGVIEGVNTTAIDMTASKTFVVNTINASASALYETRLLGAVVDIT
jgi:hypothetical protein